MIAFAIGLWHGLKSTSSTAPTPPTKYENSRLYWWGFKLTAPAM